MMNRRGFLAAFVGLLAAPTGASAQEWLGPAGLKIKKANGKWTITGNRASIDDIEWSVRYIVGDLGLGERKPTITITGVDITYPRS